MKHLIITLSVLASCVSLGAHTISFGTSTDANGVLSGESTTLSVKQSDGVAILIKHTAAFGETRLMIRTFEQTDGSQEIKKDSFSVDVHMNWTWATTGLTTASLNSGDYKYRVVLVDLNGKELCSSNLNLNIKHEGAIFIDPDKASAYGSLWDMMSVSVKKAEVSITGRSAKKGGKGFSHSIVSLAEGKEIQVALHALGTTKLNGKLKFSYTLDSNTTGTPDVTSEVKVAEGSKSAVHNAKLTEGNWKLSVTDESGVELANSSFTVTK